MSEQPSPYKGKQGFAHIFAAFNYSRDGFVAVFKDEPAFRLILLEALILVPIAAITAKTFVIQVLLILPLVLSILVELLNSAIENTLDRISLKIHPLTKKAKDMGSAAQFTSQLFLYFVWLNYLIVEW